MSQSLQKSVVVGKDDVKKITINNESPFVLIAGPCAIESEEIVMQVAEKLVEVTSKLGIPYIFKASFDKANRTSISSARGVGIENGLKILAKVREKFGIPVITDVHTEAQVSTVAQYVDMLQVPAFLCRQTDMLKACSESGLPTNIKKGQFLAPEDMKNVVKKYVDFGSEKLTQCERGAMFGYHRLVVDYTGLEIMKNHNYPVIFDATHSVQRPSGDGTSSGGNREFVESLARAAIATGVGGLFMEIHPDPENALCDGPNMVPLDKAEELLTVLKELDDFTKANPSLNIK